MIISLSSRITASITSHVEQLMNRYVGNIMCENNTVQDNWPTPSQVPRPLYWSESNFHSIHFPFPRKIYQNGIVINSSDLGLWYLPTQILTTSVIWWGKNDRFISLHKSHLKSKLTVQEFMNRSPSSDQSQHQSLVINTNCNRNNETARAWIHFPRTI